MSCNCDCKPTTVHTPTSTTPLECTPCQTPQSTTHSVRLYMLRCGSWVYAGQMPMNSAPTRGMRLLWEGKTYTIEQSTLTGSEPGTDKWEVMLIQAGPGYATISSGNNALHNPCMSCPPATLPPLACHDTCESSAGEPTAGTNHDSLCTDPWYTPPVPWNADHNTPRPVEMGLGCGPHYQCNGYPS